MTRSCQSGIARYAPAGAGLCIERSGASWSGSVCHRAANVAFGPSRTRCSRWGVSIRITSTDSEGVGDLLVEFREEAEDRVVQAQKPFADSETDRCSGETFAEGIEQVHPIGGVRCPPPFREHPAVAQEHDAVRLDVRCGLERFDESGDAAGVDGVRGRCASRQ